MLKICHWLVLLFTTTSAFALSQNEMPEPYKSVQLLPFDGQSMFHPDNASKLQHLILSKNVKTIIEVGCWLGGSTRHMAALLPPGGKLYAIDHWKGSVEHQPGQWCYFPVLPILYEQFLSNVVHAGLTDKIVPLRMSSLDAAAQLKGQIKPDLIYIDAGHETEAVYADLIAWYPYVQGHGILCGDDWAWPTVRTAVENFAREKGLKIEEGYNFWSLVE